MKPVSLVTKFIFGLSFSLALTHTTPSFANTPGSGSTCISSATLNSPTDVFASRGQNGKVFSLAEDQAIVAMPPHQGCSYQFVCYDVATDKSCFLVKDRSNQKAELCVGPDDQNVGPSSTLNCSSIIEVFKNYQSRTLVTIPGYK